jgi:V-type H+-transporting ATPase subunit a
MVTMMGFFAFCNGWIYNDFISISINAFGSCYKLEDKEWVYKDGCTYPIGIDPVWSVSENELTFVNSYKMKLSVIIGVIHMLFGILLKGTNSVFFKNWLDLIFEFVP